MNRVCLRIVTLFLIPCLLVDPALTVDVHKSRGGLSAHPVSFDSQAVVGCLVAGFRNLFSGNLGLQFIASVIRAIRRSPPDVFLSLLLFLLRKMTKSPGRSMSEPNVEESVIREAFERMADLYSLQEIWRTEVFDFFKGMGGKEIFGDLWPWLRHSIFWVRDDIWEDILFVRKMHPANARFPPDIYGNLLAALRDRPEVDGPGWYFHQGAARLAEGFTWATEGGSLGGCSRSAAFHEVLEGMVRARGLVHEAFLNATSDNHPAVLEGQARFASIVGGQDPRQVSRLIDTKLRRAKEYLAGSTNPNEMEELRQDIAILEKLKREATTPDFRRDSLNLYHSTEVRRRGKSDVLNISATNESLRDIEAVLLTLDAHLRRLDSKESELLYELLERLIPYTFLDVVVVGGEMPMAVLALALLGKRVHYIDDDESKMKALEMAFEDLRTPNKGSLTLNILEGFSRSDYVEDQPWPTNAFDLALVLCGSMDIDLGILFFDIPKALQRIYEAIRPGGSVFLPRYKTLGTHKQNMASTFQLLYTDSIPHPTLPPFQTFSDSIFMKALPNKSPFLKGAA